MLCLAEGNRAQSVQGRRSQVAAKFVPVGPSSTKPVRIPADGDFGLSLGLADHFPAPIRRCDCRRRPLLRGSPPIPVEGSLAVEVRLTSLDPRPVFEVG